MTSRGKLIATLSAGALAGAALATLAVAADLRSRAHGTHDEVVATPVCSTAASEPTFYSEMAQANARMHADMAVGPTGDVDRDFARMMIPHHQGAIDMALAQLKYGRDEKLKRLAQSIIVEQGQEIAYMRGLLATSRPQASTADPATGK